MGARGLACSDRGHLVPMSKGNETMSKRDELRRIMQDVEATSYDDVRFAARATGGIGNLVTSGYVATLCKTNAKEVRRWAETGRITAVRTTTLTGRTSYKFPMSAVIGKQWELMGQDPSTLAGVLQYVADVAALETVA